MTKIYFHNVFKIIIPVITFLIGFIILDILLGFFYSPNVSHYRKPHDYYHHDLVPNVSNIYANWAHQTYKISTNSLGFRDSFSRNISNHKEDKYRIILIGDSFTEALGVGWDYSFAGILSNSLEDKGIEILNAGTIGYSPRLYYLKTEYLLNIKKLKFDELFVFVDMSDIDNEHLYQDYKPKSKSFVDLVILHASRYSFVLRKFRQPPALSLNKQGIPFADDLKKNYESLIGNWQINDPKIKKGFRLATYNMFKLVKLCREHRIKLRIIVYPWQNNIGYVNHLQERAWKDFAITHKVDFTSLFPDFAEACNYDGKFCLDLFIPLDTHWSAAGHKFVANKILKVILNKKL